MDKRLKAYNLNFSSLKDGSHEFRHELDDKFFECFDYSNIERANIIIQVRMRKSDTMLDTEFELSGDVSSNCYRCNTPCESAISSTFRLVFKFGREISDNEELVILAPEAYQLELAPYFYEFSNLSLPSRVLHKEGECDEEMLKIMENYVIG